MKIRPARPEDAPHFVRVFEIASHGLAPYVWAKNAGQGGDILAVAMDSMRSKLDPTSGRSAFVAIVDDRIAGGVIGYSIGPEPDPIPADCDPNFVPLIELENAALNTRYVNALTVFSEFRGLGIGTALLRRMAAKSGSGGTSLIVEDDNFSARRLYEKEGYVADKSLAIVKDGWDTSANTYILMKRPSDQGDRIS